MKSHFVAENVPARKPTLDDVARLAGVAKSTASLVFAGEDAKRNVRPVRRAAVLEAAEQLGFEMNPHARHLSNGGQRKTIAIFSIGLDLGVGTRKIDFIQRVLSRSGFDVPIFSYGYGGLSPAFKQAELLNNLRLHQPRAIICTPMGMYEETTAVLQRYIEGGGIVVTYDHAFDLDCDQVVFDRGHSTYTSTHHLLQLGHRRIALVTEGQTPGPERLEGFYRAICEFGLPRDAGQLLMTAREEDGGMELAERFSTLRDRPTGYAIINDRSASAFVSALVRSGVRVPEQVSVVSHDDLATARACVVPLTAMAHPMEEIAARVAQLLLSRLDGSYDGPSRREVVKGQLNIRDSTGPLSAA